MSKKVKFLAGVLVIAAATVGGTAVYNIRMQEDTSAEESDYKTETVRRGSVSTGIQESGTITFGTSEQTFTVAEIEEVSVSSSSDSSASSSSTTGSGGGQTAELASMTYMSGNAMSGASSDSSSSGTATSLEVETVYVSVGQTVSEGDKILKITDESIEEYRTELEEAVATAKLLVSQEEINAETKKAEADYTYQMYLAEGETAEETYNATITSLEKKITDLEEQIADETDEDELEELNAELKVAQNNLTTGTLEAQQTYENAMTNYKYADQLYAIDTDGLEDDLNEAKETLETCQQNLSDFESQIGDGIVYAEYAGTITAVSYAAGDTLASDAAVITYTDSDSVTMTVSVSQDDISGVAVGDSATVYLTAYEDEPFEAEITSISTSASTGSSTVNYDVTAKITADTEKIYSGMTGEVSIAGKTVDDTLYISNRAVHLDGTRSWVKVLESDGTIREAEITTGFSNGKSVAVESGLEEGETVLIESQVEA